MLLLSARAHRLGIAELARHLVAISAALRWSAARLSSLINVVQFKFLTVVIVLKV